MSQAENCDQDTIPILIDSYGGEVYSLLAMIDCIKSSRKKIATIALGKSMSCGAVLLTFGHDGLRFAASMSTILIHDVSKWTNGKIGEIKADVNEADRLNDLIYSLMDSNCGKNQGYFKDIVHGKGHADWFLTSQEAKEHNIVNHIRIPNFEINITANIKFG